MEIEYGKLYLNRTWKYLYPALRVYEPKLINYLNGLIKVGVGIYDTNYQEDEEDKKIPKIFILIKTVFEDKSSLKTRTYNKNVMEFFEYVKQQEFYVDDYLYEITEDSCVHMLVLKYPESFIEVFNNFKVGAYHKMYHPTSVKSYFPLKNLNQVYNKSAFKTSKSLGNNLEIHGVLLKDKVFQKVFCNIISEDFEMDVKDVKIEEHHDLDYPPDLKEEIFNS